MSQTKLSSTLPRTGSIKDKIVAPDLLDERAKRNFDGEELTHVLFRGKDKYDDYKENMTLGESDPVLRNTHEWYDMTREEKQDTLIRKVRRAWELRKEKFFTNYSPDYIVWYQLMFPGQVTSIRNNMIFKGSHRLDF